MKQRIITGIVAGIIFLALTVAGGWYFYALMAGMAAIGYAELIRMSRIKVVSPISITGFIGLAAILFPYEQLGYDRPDSLQFVWITLFVFLTFTVLTKNEITIHSASTLVVGLIYVGVGFDSMHTVRLAEHGLLLTLLTFITIWASDSGAYFVGRAIGRTKLWPSISPNKTIEGSLGGITLAMVVALIIALTSKDVISLERALLIGAIAAVAGQLGDLIESAYKRFFDAKDSGTLLPGHGGILDRSDSWLIVFPILVYSGILPLA